jgi:TolB-like protein/Tfp pilus assembly protein PilF
MKFGRLSPLGSEFHAGGWAVQPQACRIANEDQERRLRPMLMKLLVLLAEHAGQVVTKDRILDQVWEARFVSESALTRDIADLRRLLGDSRKRPQYIETIPKRGYRFIAPVKAGRPIREPRLAVLLFENLNRDPELDYFAEGITDALITELGGIRSMRVISRQSVRHYKDSDKSLPDIARELKVDSVLEGSVLHAGNRVRIAAQLIQAEPEQHLWARNYDCESTDILKIQAEVARAVAESAQAVLTPRDLARLTREIRVKPETHVAYLKARYHVMQWTPDGMQKGMARLQQAIAADPGYAPNYELLAVCLASLGFWGHIPTQQVFPQAKAAALKAVELDENLSEGHAALGLVAWMYDWDLERSRRELELAIDLNPSSAFSHGSYALYLVTVPRDADRALEHARMELDLDPLSLSANFGNAWILFFAGLYDQAVDQAVRTLEMYPDALQANFALGWAFLGRSRFEDATAAFEKAAASSRDAVSLGYLGYAHGLAGRKDAAGVLLGEMLEKARREYVPQSSLAYLYLGVGDVDGALAALEKCFDERDSRLFWFPLALFSDALLKDPRFQALIRRMPH